MWNKNIETFLGCDADYEEARIVLFGAPLIPPLPIDRARDLPAKPCVQSLTGWKPTVRIRIWI